MTQYVVSFVFDNEGGVALVKKNRPKWQEGRWNGIGGKIENNEPPIHAAQRELKEEANIHLLISEIGYVCTMTGKDWKVHVFTAELGSLKEMVETMTDEEIGVIDEFDVMAMCRRGETISNIGWLIHMCRNSNRIDYKITNNEDILCPFIASV